MVVFGPFDVVVAAVVVGSLDRIGVVGSVSWDPAPKSLLTTRVLSGHQRRQLRCQLPSPSALPIEGTTARAKTSS